VLPHPLDLVALILGILFTLRQMHVSNRQLDQHPGVSAENFEQWKRRALSAYRLGSSACFAKVLLDIGLSQLMARVALPSGLRIGIGLSLDIGWVALVIYSYVRVTRARSFGREVGIEAPAPSRQGPSEG
jgi:hypothetical protein